MSYEQEPYRFEEDNPAANRGANDARAADTVRVPAILLLITGIFTFIGAVANVVFHSTIPDRIDQNIEEIRQDPQMPAKEKENIIDSLEWLKDVLSNPLMYVSYAVGAVAGILIIIGSVQMLNLSGLALPVTACILAMIPCFSGCCCVVGLPAGIWGLVVLSQPYVKEAIFVRRG